MASPRWQQFFSGHKGLGTVNTLLFKILRPMALFPDVMRGLRRYYLGQIEHEYIRSRVQQMCDAVRSFEAPVQNIIKDASLVAKSAPHSSESPVDEVYRTEDFAVSRLCCVHAVTILTTNNMLSALDGHVSEEIRRKNRSMSERIWKFHEQAADVGSYGMHYYPSALILSYESAQSRETEDWIVGLLNLVQGRKPATHMMWTREEIAVRCKGTRGVVSSPRPS